MRGSAVPGEELGAPAADIQHDQTVRRHRQSGADPQKGEPPLLLSGDDGDLQSGFVPRERQKWGAVCGLAQRAGADGEDGGRALGFGQFAEAPQHAHGPPDRLGLEYPGREQALAQPRYLLGGQDCPVAGADTHVGDEEPDRIRPHINDRHTDRRMTMVDSDCRLENQAPSANRQSPFVNVNSWASLRQRLVRRHHDRLLA
jgi:hypothetical protein